MSQSGYLMLNDIECVYVEDKNTLLLTPTNNQNASKIRKYAYDKGYYLKYIDGITRTVHAYVTDAQMEIGPSVKLTVSHYFRILPNDGIIGFDVIGDEIDNFFNPVDIYYGSRRNNSKVDLKYQKELIDSFYFTYANKQIKVELHVGDVLSEGIRSDLILHPRLQVSFEKTHDLEFIYSIYHILSNAMKIMRHNQTCNIKQVTLYGYINERFQYVGYFNENPYMQGKSFGFSECRYTYFKSYISNILQLVADNYDDQYLSFPDEHSEPFKYDIRAFTSIFGAFERECHKVSNLYETASDLEIMNVKSKIISRIKESQTDATSAELQFISDSVQAISRLWKQFGQKRKIINACTILKPILNESIEQILCRDGLHKKAFEERIRCAARKIVDLRGKIVHGEFCREFSDEETQYVQLIDIVCYAQLLKRAGISDKDIEIIIGVTHYCNAKYFEVLRAK